MLVIEIPINEHLSKELANKIIELIEDANGYKWNYNHLYTSKNIHPNNEILLLWKDLIVEVL